MVEQTSITAAGFFWNAAAQDVGFSSSFWVEAYQRYLDAVEQDPSRSRTEDGTLRARCGFPSGRATLTFWSGRTRRDVSTPCCASQCFQTAVGPNPVSWAAGIGTKGMDKKPAPCWERQSYRTR